MKALQDPRCLTQISALRSELERLRRQGRSIGVVPTMGALHEGHLTLIDRAKAHSDDVFVTVFVNPTQFGPGEDFASYPRTLGRDLELSLSRGASFVFAPEASQMYPSGDATRVRVSGLTEHFCGPSRPSHFEGVATVVAKLWGLFAPCTAVFGRKDYQQLAVIRRMTSDLLFPVEILGHKTVREPDGLALSSRNAYLGPSEREQARAIPEALRQANQAFRGGERRVGQLRQLARERLEAAGLRVVYVELGHPDSLEVLSDEGLAFEQTLIAVAAYAGTTRLIDNLVLGEEDLP